MPLRFTKMQGIGNDYVYVDTFREKVDEPAELARRISDRHFGVGGDGLILIAPPGSASNDCRMEMYNSDGSRGGMCGNGIRCVAKYVHDHGIARRDELRIETDAGVKTIRIERDAEGLAERMTVDMGPPRLRRHEIPMRDDSSKGTSKGDDAAFAIEVPLEVLDATVYLTAVSMGNPHAVVRLDRIEGLPKEVLRSVDAFPLERYGPALERHAAFPDRVNAEFVLPRSRREIDFRVWERGSGETLACGTGACAAVVAGVLADWCERRATVHLRGGDLEIEWLASETADPHAGSVLMTGGATEVFRGELR